MTSATTFLNATSGGEIDRARRQDFLALYPNRHKSILKSSSKTDRKADWVTLSRHAPLTDAQLLNALSLKENFLRGCRWGDQTKFAVLDVDKKSQLHNELGVARLKHSLADVGFNKPLLFQSSESGGWHLYLPFSSWVNAVEVQSKLKAWLQAEGYEIRCGQLEIFPSNNGLRLPLQKGFAWLDENAELKLNRESLTTDQAIAHFLDALDESAHSWATIKIEIERRLHELTTKAPTSAEEQEDGFSKFFTHAGMIQEVYEAGRNYWLNGLTAPGQRHHATLCIGHYLWYGDEEAAVRALPGIRQADKRAAAIESWLRKNHNGHSRAILKGNWDEVLSDIRSACHWTQDIDSPQESYPVTERAIDRLEVLTKQTGRIWYPEDFEKGNIGREERAREKIRTALNRLLEEGRRITVRGLERLSGCRRETIRRHSDIWSALRLSNGLGDLRLAPVALSLVPDVCDPPILQSEEVIVLDSVQSSDSKRAVLNLVSTSQLVLHASVIFDVYNSSSGNPVAKCLPLMEARPMLKIPTFFYSLSLTLLFATAAFAESSTLFENRIDKLRMELRNESMLSSNTSKTECHFLTLVDKDPGCATAGARVFVERSLKRLNKAVSPELPEPVNINEQLSHLTLKKVLPSSKALALTHFTTIANEAAHGAQFDSPALKSFLVEDMPRVLAFLEEILLKIR